MRVCILGATGLVGRETIDLVRRAWPGAELDLYASRDQTLEHAGEKLKVSGAAQLEAADAKRGELAFVALDDEHSKRYVPRLLALGYRVIDKSSTYRGDPNVPLGVAGVNHALITEDVKLVANPNCTTIPLLLALQPLLRFGLSELTVSTYQAVSGAGIAPLDQFLEDQRRGYSEFERLGTRFDAASYAGNVVPHNGGTDDSGYSKEEHKLMFEARKVLALPELSIAVQCCRVAVAVGHYENVWLTLSAAAKLEQIAELWSSTPFVRFVPGASGEGISTLVCLKDRDAAWVGRLRPDPRDKAGKRLCFTVVGDNLRVGAATNAVRLAARWYPSRDAALNPA